MTKAVYNGSTTTNYTYAGADQSRCCRCRPPAVTTAPSSTAAPTRTATRPLTSSTTNGTRAKHRQRRQDPGKPIALSSPSGVLGQYQYDGSGNIWGTLVDNPAAFDKSYDPYGTSTVAYNGGGDGLPSNPSGSKPVSTTPTPGS